MTTYNKLTVSELLILLRDNDINIPNKYKKADLVNLANEFIKPTNTINKTTTPIVVPIVVDYKTIMNNVYISMINDINLILDRIDKYFITNNDCDIQNDFNQILVNYKTLLISMNIDITVIKESIYNDNMVSYYTILTYILKLADKKYKILNKDN